MRTVFALLALLLPMTAISATPADRLLIDNINQPAAAN